MSVRVMVVIQIKVAAIKYDPSEDMIVVMCISRGADYIDKAI